MNVFNLDMNRERCDCQCATVCIFDTGSLVTATLYCKLTLEMARVVKTVLLGICELEANVL